MKNKMKKIYTIEDSVDCYMMMNIITEIYGKKIKKECTLEETTLLVESKYYQKFLNIITDFLLRYETKEKIEWFDIYEEKHPYQNIRVAALCLTPSYYKKIQNNPSSLAELQDLYFKLDKDSPAARATILTSSQNQFVYIEKDLTIYTKETPNAWKNLKQNGIQGIFEQQSRNTLSLISNNIQELAPYIEEYSMTNRVGKVLRK
ncbi:MAG: hypothetical protein PUB18_06250 [bacterium]|nr:hypothetical protein [bacterium]